MLFCRSGPTITKEETWLIKAAVVVVTAVQEKCTRQSALSAKKNVKFLLSPEKIVRYTARIAIQSARTRAVNFRLGYWPPTTKIVVGGFYWGIMCQKRVSGTRYLITGDK